MTENEIRNLFEQWVDAFNAHDVERDRTLYAEDVALYQAPVKKTLDTATILRSLGIITIPGVRPEAA
ncbi:MAG: hypothetical protein IBX64_06270 [Actinobacteria bacterium]|nr:hypothetical protein [Actinomycetota bacterium]